MTSGAAEGAAEEGNAGPEGAFYAGEAGLLSGASQVSGGSEREGAELEDRAADVMATLDHPPVKKVAAEEVLRALEAAGSNGEVGEGGFGKVYAVELRSQAGWGRVAVKRASVQAADILQEVATLQMCSHRNVLPLLGYCDDARAMCMITPLMCGGSLDDRLLLSDSGLERLSRLSLEGNPSLDWQQRLSALCDAARGLAHLHSKRILGYSREYRVTWVNPRGFRVTWVKELGLTPNPRWG